MSVLVECLDVSLVEGQERRICERSINNRSENLPLAVSIVIEEKLMVSLVTSWFTSWFLRLWTLTFVCLLLNWLDEEYGDIVRR